MDTLTTILTTFIPPDDKIQVFSEILNNVWHSNYNIVYLYDLLMLFKDTSKKLSKKHLHTQQHFRKERKHIKPPQHR